MSNLEQSIGALGGKINSECRYVETYWSKAPKNCYLSFKEAAAYCIGGIGINAASMVQAFLTLSYGMYVAAALNLSNDMIMWVGIVTSVITILRSPLISYLVDNTNTKYGKFRPYLIWMPIPCLITIALMGWTPVLMQGTEMRGEERPQQARTENRYGGTFLRIRRNEIGKSLFLQYRKGEL